MSGVVINVAEEMPERRDLLPALFSFPLHSLVIFGRCGLAAEGKGSWIFADAPQIVEPAAPLAAGACAWERGCRLEVPFYPAVWIVRFKFENERKGRKRPFRLLHYSLLKDSGALVH